jgi:5-methylcytosine-specific restriction protein B
MTIIKNRRIYKIKTKSNMNIIEINQKVLDIYSKHKDKYNDFTFALRSKKDKRLIKGQWFQGSNYIFTSPYRLADDNNKTQQVGFVINSDSHYLEIPLLANRNKDLEPFYKEVIEYFGIEYKGWGQKYYKGFKNNLEQDLESFLNIDVPVINNIAKKHNINNDRLFYSKDEFNKRLSAIENIQTVLQQIKLYQNNPNIFPTNANVVWYFKFKDEENTYPVKAILENIKNELDIDYYSTDVAKTKLKQIFGKNNIEFIDISSQDKEEDFSNNPDTPKNQILYGPPGTGKTYSTVSLALDILGESDRKNDITSIGKLKEEFDSQVEFITFHQSFSYEDFVEGLKANSDGEKITYNIEDGIFKKICENAKNSGNDSLSNLNEVINKLKEQLSEEPLELKTLAKHKPFTLTNQTKNGFYAQPNDGNSYNPVNITSITEFYKNPDLKDMRTGAIFKSYVMPVIKYLQDNFKLENYQETTDKKPHILIIDEINRGNISQIFGELITLLEETKRAGQKEAITLQLPYSKESFSVPDNLYIIGTMNTADRSLTMMDTALRRRFDFIEILPNPHLEQISVNCGEVNLQQLLKTINERIEILYDREHLIGHSFLMNINDLQSLRKAFKNKILPLLEEYFYDDFEKINLVLGSDNFYKKQEPNLFKDEQYNKAIYKKQNIEELSAQAFIDIYAE